MTAKCRTCGRLVPIIHGVMLDHTRSDQVWSERCPSSGTLEFHAAVKMDQVNHAR